LLVTSVACCNTRLPVFRSTTEDSWAVTEGTAARFAGGGGATPAGVLLTAVGAAGVPASAAFVGVVRSAVLSNFLMSPRRNAGAAFGMPPGVAGAAGVAVACADCVVTAAGAGAGAGASACACTCAGCVTLAPGAVGAGATTGTDAIGRVSSHRRLAVGCTTAL
jgi:hypothetical protein